MPWASAGEVLESGVTLGRWLRPRVVWLLVSTLVSGCGRSPEGAPTVDEAAHTDFLPNEACAPCHPRQVAEYAGSAMRYAAFSPVFNALEIALAEVHGAPFADNGLDLCFCIKS